MQAVRKSNTKKILVIVLIAILICIGGFCVYTKFFAPAPTMTEPDNQSVEAETDTNKPVENTPIDSSTPIVNDSYDDGYVENKTPIQYEGQTDGSKIHGDYNNEQFRIPEGEL